MGAASCITFQGEVVNVFILKCGLSFGMVIVEVHIYRTETVTACTFRALKADISAV